MGFPVKSIGIVGGGVVGSAIFHTYANYCQASVWDLIPEKRIGSFIETVSSDLVFICLPTPQKANSLELDTSAIYDFLRQAKIDLTPLQFKDFILQQNLVLKSTVPIGFTDKIAEEYQLSNLIHSPEFLTARTANIDAIMPRVNIIGGTSSGKTFIQKNPCGHVLSMMCTVRFPGVRNVHVTNKESEAIKLITNSFFATKIAFFNEMYQLVRKLGMSWEDVLSGVLADGRISHSHTQVPGPDGQFGYGGSCLPKDLAQIVEHLCYFGLHRDVTEGTLKRNSLHDRLDKSIASVFYRQCEDGGEK